jgi:hypothetical protein
VDIEFRDCGGSGLGTDSNGPVPQPGPFAVAIYPVAPSGGTPIEPDSKIDGGAVGSFDPNGATSEMGGGAVPSAPSPDSIGQPNTGQTYPTGSNYPS